MDIAHGKWNWLLLSSCWELPTSKPGILLGSSEGPCISGFRSLVSATRHKIRSRGYRISGVRSTEHLQIPVGRAGARSQRFTRYHLTGPHHTHSILAHFYNEETAAKSPMLLPPTWAAWVGGQGWQRARAEGGGGGGCQLPARASAPPRIRSRCAAPSYPTFLGLPSLALGVQAFGILCS